MTLDIPSPRGFLVAPNGARSSMRLALVLAVITVLLILLIAGATFLWVAIYYPDTLNQLMAGDGALALIGGYIVRGIAKYKAFQAQHESTPLADGAAVVPASGFLDDQAQAVLVSHNLPILPQAAVNLILSQEGIDQPWLVPSGESGVSIGYGYDLGYEQHFERDWSGVLPADWVSKLRTALGLRESKARAVAGKFKGMRITAAMASRVFYARTLPQEVAAAQKAMPGFDNAPPLVQGAIVSLGYNRGWGMHDEPGQKSRQGMRDIRDAVAAGRWSDIPGFLRAMAPLWPAGNGVHTRRLAEAKLAESGLMQSA